jgi:hypothetical protein
MKYRKYEYKVAFMGHRLSVNPTQAYELCSFSSSV